MTWWPIFGLMHRITKRGDYTAGLPVQPFPRTFRRSLHVYPLDLGNSNALNMEIAALKTALYNPHRLGIFFAGTPRHADVLIFLGDLARPLEEALATTLLQVPRPYGVVWAREGIPPHAVSRNKVEQIVKDAGGSLLCVIDELEGPTQLLGVLRDVMKAGVKQ